MKYKIISSSGLIDFTKKFESYMNDGWEPSLSQISGKVSVNYLLVIQKDDSNKSQKNFQ